MIDSPMRQVLDNLIREADDGVVIVQLLFNPGASAAVGALAAGPVDGTYKLGGMSRAEGGPNAGKIVQIEQIFEASAVQRVVLDLGEPSQIVTQGSRFDA